MYRKKWRRTKQIVPLLTAAFAMSFSAIGAASVNGQPVIAEDAVSAQGPVMAAVRAVSPSAIETGAAQPSAAPKADGSCPTYQEAYEKMAALKSTYPEGTAWTNFTPYGRDGDKGSDYVWKGGKIKGADRGVGCAAFAFILSDEAFGALPARAVDRGGFQFDDVKVGDILRVNNNSHFVIVLQKSTEGVTVAEGNYNKSVHWGRAMSKAEVEGADFIITRYPENYVPADAPGANEVTQSGQEGSLQWTLTNAGTLTISGSGAIPDYNTTDFPAPWKEYNDSISTIVIGTGVTSIGAYAFYQSKALSVYIPEGVTAIGDSAFREAKLIAVTIPGTVKSIGNDAFQGSSANPSNLTSVSVAEGLETIGERAFQGCTALTHIDFPASVSKIGAGAFMSCENMIRVRFMPGSGEVEIGDNLFSQCRTLTSVTLPKTLTRISPGMFSSCSSLSELYIPATVKQIGEVGSISGSPFFSCPQSMTIKYGGTQAEWDSFMVDSTLMGSLQQIKAQVVCGVEFVDPFAPIPDDPGDFAPAHEHSWATVWASNENYHWHECSAESCPVTEDSRKDGYAVHNYGNWVIDVNATASQAGSQHRECTVCGYRQSESIPASSGGSSSSGGSYGSGSSSGNTSPGIIPPVSSTTTPDANSTTSPDTDTTPVATTLPDGTKVEEKTETRENGTKVETKVETKTDGSRTETVIETAADGAVKTIKTETAADGSAVRTENEAVKTSAGTSADLTTTTILNAGGTIASVTQKAVIEKAAANTSATVVVRKDADGKTTAADASVSKTVSGNKAFLTGAVVAQLKEISGEDNLAVTLTVKDNSGRTKFKVKANADDLHPGNELYIYQYNNNTGEYMMINETVYKVNKNGSVGVSMSKSATYQLLSAAKAKKINRQILAAVAVKNASATIKPGKSTKLALNSKLNKANVKSIKYAVPKNAPVKVSKNGKITAKKAGTVKVKAKVTLKNGMKKTVKMKVVVK